MKSVTQSESRRKNKKKNTLKSEEEKIAKDGKTKFGKYFKKGLLKAATKVGMIDKHQIEPKFDKNIQHMVDYQHAVLEMYTGCEALMQPNPELYKYHHVHESKPSDNSHMRLAISLDFMKEIGVINPQIKIDRHIMFFFNQSEKEMVISCIQLAKDLAQTETKYRNLAVSYTNNTVDFLVSYTNELAVLRNKLKEALAVMDELSVEVRRAKTNEELKKIGPTYEEAVNSFNRSSIEITDFWLYNYPKFNYLHQRDLVKYHMARITHHKEMARQIRECLERTKEKKEMPSKALLAEKSRIAKSPVAEKSRVAKSPALEKSRVAEKSQAIEKTGLEKAGGSLEPMS